MTWIENVYNQIKATVSSKLNETGYQSPLELEGLARREVAKRQTYYQKAYPYVDTVDSDNGLIRTNSALITTSLWRPETVNIQKTIIDGELENMSSSFDILTNSSVYTQQSTVSGVDKSDYMPTFDGNNGQLK